MRRRTWTRGAPLLLCGKCFCPLEGAVPWEGIEAVCACSRRVGLELAGPSRTANVGGAEHGDAVPERGMRGGAVLTKDSTTVGIASPTDSARMPRA
jgi:hypothetical protein